MPMLVSVPRCVFTTYDGFVNYAIMSATLYVLIRLLQLTDDSINFLLAAVQQKMEEHK